MSSPAAPPAADATSPLVELLVEHSPTYDYWGYATGCDGCGDGPYPEWRFRGDTAPLRAWATHIATLYAQVEAATQPN